MKVKTFPGELWDEVKAELYDDEARGSHNQILARIYSCSASGYRWVHSQALQGALQKGPIEQRP